MPYKDLFTQKMEEYLTAYSVPKTYENKRWSLKKFYNWLRDRANRTYPLSIDFSSLLAYKNYLFKSGLHPNTVNQCIGWACQFLIYCGNETIENTYYNRRKKRLLMVPVPENGQIAYLELVEINRILDFLIDKFKYLLTCDNFGEEFKKAEDSAYMYLVRYVMFFLTLTTGLRLSEMLGINVSDLDFEKRRIHIRKLKCGNNQVSLVTAELGELLQRFLIARELYIQRRTYGEKKGSDFEPLFVNIHKRSKGTRYTKSSIEHLSKQIKEGTGIKKFHWHILRHTCGKLLVRNGAGIDDVQLVLHHKRHETTERFYVRINMDDRQGEIERFLPRLAGPKR